MSNKTLCGASTSMNINASKLKVWSKVGFYEHVTKAPSWLLRLSLPVPLAVEGKHKSVGDTCRCRYSDGGYLTKRITRVLDGNRIEFEIIEQSIRYQNSIKLLGGYIEVEESGNNKSSVNMVTYYDNRIRFKLISGYFINMVIKIMHRFVMNDMQSQLGVNSANSATVIEN